MFCREARVRIDQYLRQMFGPNDTAVYQTAMGVLGAEFSWLEQGIVDTLYSAPTPAAPSAAPSVTRAEKRQLAGVAS